MGFINAILEIGKLDEVEGIEAYIKFPLDQEGKVIQVYLDILDPQAEVLKITGVKDVKLSDLIKSPEMKRKYLFRETPGKNVTWAFSPVQRIGKPKSSVEKNRDLFLGTNKDWQKNKDTLLYKIKHRVLDDYEKERVFSNGSVDLIMQDLSIKLEELYKDLDKNFSHIIVFGAATEEGFLYPGDIPAFVKYFQMKLQKSLSDHSNLNIEYQCAICGKNGNDMTTLDKVFKFANFDKISFLPALDVNEKFNRFPVCQQCFKNISSGRERVERTLSNNSVLPRIKIWIIPEVFGVIGDNTKLSELTEKLEKHIDQDKINSIGAQREEGLFSRLKKAEQTLVFHFVFWEQNQNQELVHLMVEDVPPERLARLEENWKKAMTTVLGDVQKGLNLDWAFKSLYVTLNAFANKTRSENDLYSDKIVFRDFALKVISNMLHGQKVPVDFFKKLVVSRIPRLVYEGKTWDDIQKNMLYAQVWVEFMSLLNRGVIV